MNAFDYKGPSQITKQIMFSHKTSVNSTKSVEKARDNGSDPGTLYGISRKGDESVARYNALRQLGKRKLEVKIAPNEINGERHGNKEDKAA